MHLAATDGQIDRVEREFAPEPLGEILDDQRVGGRRPGRTKGGRNG